MYFVDSCSFIELRLRYPKETFPSIWGQVDDALTNDQIFSCEEIYRELSTKDDEIKELISKHKKSFKPFDTNVEQELIKLLKQMPHLIDLKKGKSGADPVLVATAMAYGGTIVTQEKEVGGNAPVIKIPNACKKFNIPCIAFLDMLKQLKIKS